MIRRDNDDKPPRRPPMSFLLALPISSPTYGLAVDHTQRNNKAQVRRHTARKTIGTMGGKQSKITDQDKYAGINGRPRLRCAQLT